MRTRRSAVARRTERRDCAARDRYVRSRRVASCGVRRPITWCPACRWSAGRRRARLGEVLRGMVVRRLLVGLRGRPAVLRLTGARLARVRVIIGVLGCRGVKRRLAVAGRAVWRPGMCLLTVLPAVRAIWRRRVARRLAPRLVKPPRPALPPGPDARGTPPPPPQNHDLQLNPHPP